MFATDASRQPITHIRGWHTYDVSFKLTGRRGVRSMTFFAGNDMAASAQSDLLIEQVEGELSTSRAVVLAYDIKVTRRVTTPERAQVSSEDRESSGLTRLHRGMNARA